MKRQNDFNGKRVAKLLTAVAVVCISQITFAQDRWSIEFRPGVNFATTELGDIDLKTGFGLEGSVAYRFMPHLAVYAGWSWNKFGSDARIDGTNLDFEETGYTYGLQFIHPIGESKINFIARVGGLANHIEVEQDDDIISDSDHGFGWQVEGGLAIPLGASWRLMPSVRYRSLASEIEIQTVTTSVVLNYISVGLGLAILL